VSARFHSLLSLGKHACIQNAAKLGESLHRLLNNPDAEAVHDVRVACRRLGVALRIIEPLYQRRNLKPLAKKIKALRARSVHLRPENQPRCCRR
jgi:CHAD domain-containing protein